MWDKNGMKKVICVFCKLLLAAPALFAEAWYVAPEKDSRKIEMDSEFTLVVRFRTDQSHAVLAGVNPSGKWVSGGKVLFLSGGRLSYDIGWLGIIKGETKCNDGEWHQAVVTFRNGRAQLFLDGKLESERKSFTAPDPLNYRFKVGQVAPDFPGRDGSPFDGEFAYVKFWGKALDVKEIAALGASKLDGVAEPVLSWKPDPGRKTRSIVADAARAAGDENIDHARLIREWDHNALDRGAKIYNMLCVTCHGTDKQEGTLPTALKFHEAPFKNGKEPYQMYETISKGFGQMVAQTWMTPRQKYDVIHYIRETYLSKHNPSQYTEVTDAYLASLPKGTSTGPDAVGILGGDRDQKYENMDFGPFLMWTYQVDKDNIAYKGIAIRLDPGPGGVSKGRAWMVYDHDTLRVAAAYTGKNFVDWKGIAFDGSHGTHTSIVGDKLFVNPVGPGVAQPGSNSWEDPRFVGRDNKPYGPLPRDWAHYKGLYIDGGKVVLKYAVGDAEIHESPSLIDFGQTPIFARTLNIGKASEDLTWRLAPDSDELNVSVSGSEKASIVVENGFYLLRVPASVTPVKLSIFHTRALAEEVGKVSGTAFSDLQIHVKGGPAHWSESVSTRSEVHFDEKGAFAVDRLSVPDDNPWNAWMRLGGFDFHPDDPNKAAVCTWMGDVWLVEGVGQPAPATLTWKRIATGLFQPLGVKYRDGELFVTCRDQLARLVDLNDDGEIDYIDSFNNDHQVTEHFHEFAMGLQTDEEGNFYYAKSARHAKTALVAHHGTLLKVSRDGATTEILATGFRAANGVCLNPDGSFIVTDQEGHWNPKNRINYVRKGGFYGNMYGYTDVTDSSDEAMSQPLCWITNQFDRSPAELLWVPGNAKWGPLNGMLLNLSYGYGQAYVVPHELIKGQAQGGMCALPIPRLPTGIMRGRFSPLDGQLYTCGMFAWAGSQHKPGGFYRIRYTGKPAGLPTGIEARKQSLILTFSDPVDPASVSPEAFAIKAWDLKRTKSYGSRHYNERTLVVSGASLSADGKQVTLKVPEIAPTWSMSVKYALDGSAGAAFSGEIHNTIHTLNP